MHTLGSRTSPASSSSGVPLVDPTRWASAAVDVLPNPDTYAVGVIESSRSSTSCALGWRSDDIVALTAGIASSPAAAMSMMRKATPVPIVDLLIGADIDLVIRAAPYPRRIRSRDTTGWADSFSQLVADGRLIYPASDVDLGRQVDAARCATDPKVISARLTSTPTLVAKAALWAAVAALDVAYLDPPTIW